MNLMQRSRLFAALQDRFILAEELQRQLKRSKLARYRPYAKQPASECNTYKRSTLTVHLSPSRIRAGGTELSRSVLFARAVRRLVNKRSYSGCLRRSM